MPNLEIYGSQGEPLADDKHQVNERIQDYFYAGVRLVIDTSGNRLELVSFFRARDSQSGRANQYYALYTSDQIRDLDKFEALVRQRVEDEHGLILDTSTEDTTIFEMLLDGTRPSVALDHGKLRDLKDVLERGDKVKLGVGSYRDAFGLVREFADSVGGTSCAIAENANSSCLDRYELVIEQGDYLGTEIFDETQDAIEDLKEQRRRELGGPYGSTDDDSLLDRVGTTYLAAGGFVGLILLLTIGSYGACFMGVSVPVVGDSLPGTDCGGDGVGQGTTYDMTISTLSYNNTDSSFHVAGNITNTSGGTSPNFTDARLTVAREDTNASASSTINVSQGTLDHDVPVSNVSNWTGEYNTSLQFNHQNLSEPLTG